MTLQLYAEIPAVEALSDLENEHPEAQLAALEDAWASLSGQRYREAVEADLLSLGRAIKTLVANDKALEDHQAEVAVKRLALQSRIEYLKGYTLNLCLQTGIERAKDALVTVYTQRNNPSVDVEDAGAVPDEYKRATLVLPLAEVPAHLRDRADVQVLKQAILDAFKSDGVVPDGVRIETAARHLRVR